MKKPATWHFVLLGTYTLMAFWFLGISAFPAAKDTCLLIPGVKQDACASWVQAFGSIAAILAAVWIMQRQHAKDVERDERQTIEARVEQVNAAMLVMLQQANTLGLLKSQLLDRYAEQPGRHLAMPAVEHLNYGHWVVDWPRLAFVSATSAKDALLTAILGHNAFHSAMAALNERSRLHRDELQPLLEKAGVAGGAPFSTIEKLAGPRLSAALAATTESLFHNLEVAVRDLGATGTTGAATLRVAHRGHPILGFRLEVGGARSVESS